MTRQPNTHGGGINANINGLIFEKKTSLKMALERCGFSLEPICHDENTGYKIYKGKSFLGYSVPQYRLYTDFLKPNKINYKEYNSKKWLPDECFINIKTKIAFIIEKKFQSKSGSVDEKLLTGHFKKMEYKKLFKPLGYRVIFIYVLSSEWFTNKPAYDDTFQYIEDMDCEYYFDKIPLDKLYLE